MTSRNIVKDYAKKIKSVRPYNRYPDISDRKAWEGLPKELKEVLIKEGEKALKKPWTQLLISDFTEFSRSGNRVQFEDKYFPRRRKLNSLVMAECVENKGRFLKDILDGLYLILEETTWCLPPHNSYERDEKQETMPDVTRPIIDLFDAESAAEVAYCEYLLRPVFSKESPFISTYVNERLWDRIFLPYENRHFWWMGNGEEPMCNWTPWCTQNVLISALTRPEGFFTEKELLEFVKKAAASCDYFLDEYGDDGGCDEGAQYYSHAALCLFGCLELMDGSGFCKDKNGFHGIFEEELIRNVANFIVKMHVSGDYYVNFADCSAKPGRRTAREFLFGKTVKDPVLASFAALDVQKQSIAQKLITDEINLFYHVQQAFAYEDMMKCEKMAALAEDSFFESVGLVVARDKTFTLAAKAGDNGDSHNHNDVGSFTIYKNGKPMIIDLGVGTYTAKTFSDSRYELWTMQSQFHNLPTFFTETLSDKELFSLGQDSASDHNDKRIVMQKPGETYAASDVTCLLCKNEAEGISSLKMNIAAAYDCKAVGKYTRCISLNKGKNITVTDEYTGTLPGILSLMTYEKPEIAMVSNDDTDITDMTNNRCDANKTDESSNESGFIRIKIGKLGFCTVKGAHEAIIQEFPIIDERLKTAWKHEVYRVLITIEPMSKLHIVFQ